MEGSQSLVASIYAVGVRRKWRRIYGKKEKQQQQQQHSKGHNNNKQNERKKFYTRK